MTIPASSASRPNKHVVIVGGGITGLSAAWRLQQAGVPYTLIERSDGWGGKVHTETVTTDTGEAFVIETGADAFLTRKPWALQLAHELGLHDRIIGVNGDNNRTFVLSGGRLVPIPDGVRLIAPTQLLPFLRSPLFSWRGKLRMLLDWVIPAKTDDADESLADFVTRRVGAEALDKLAEPLLAGIFNAETDRQSILATFPQYRALEREHSSLIRGLRAAAAKHIATPSAQPAFFSFKGGTREIVDTLVARLNGDLRLNTGIETITVAPDGYCIRLGDGTMLNAAAIILTTPAKVAAGALQMVAPAAVAPLRSIRYASIGTLSLGYRAADVPHPLDGLGVVIPGSEGRPIDGITFTTTKWNHRAPTGYRVLRVFFGGPNTRATMDMDDTTVIDTVRRELADLLDIEAEPLFVHLSRWHNAYPQYDVGHLDRVAAIEAALPPGIAVAGSSYRGIGVPDCIHQADRAADLIQTYLTAEPTAQEHIIYGNDAIRSTV